MRHPKKIIACFIFLFFFFSSNKTQIHQANSATDTFCNQKTAIEWPVGITQDKSGNLYLAQGLVYNTIGKIDPSGNYSVLAGTPNEAGYKDGIKADAKFSGPADLVVDSKGENLYVSDYFNHVIRRVRISDGEVITVAGTAGRGGFVNGRGGIGTATKFFHPSGIGIDKNDNLYVADSTNSVIRKIGPAPDYEVTTFAGSGTRGWKDGPIDQAQFSFPEDVAFDDTTGNLYVSENGNQTIRQISPKSGSPATVSTLATVFGAPHGVAVDKSGTVYFTDSVSQIVGTISRTGVVNTIAGQSGIAGNADGDGLLARFNQPLGISLDDSEKIYITDFRNKSIRTLSSLVDPATHKKSYVVTTLYVCPAPAEPLPSDENIGKR